MCMCASLIPGMTTRPRASITRVEDPPAAHRGSGPDDADAVAHDRERFGHGAAETPVKTLPLTMASVGAGG